MSHLEPLSQWMESVSSMLQRVELSASQSAGRIVCHHAGVGRLSAAGGEL